MIALTLEKARRPIISNNQTPHYPQTVPTISLPNSTPHTPHHTGTSPFSPRVAETLSPRSARSQPAPSAHLCHVHGVSRPSRAPSLHQSLVTGASTLSDRAGKVARVTMLANMLLQPSASLPQRLGPTSTHTTRLHGEPAEATHVVDFHVDVAVNDLLRQTDDTCANVLQLAVGIRRTNRGRSSYH